MRQRTRASLLQLDMDARWIHFKWYCHVYSRLFQQEHNRHRAHSGTADPTARYCKANASRRRIHSDAVTHVPWSASAEDLLLGQSSGTVRQIPGALATNNMHTTSTYAQSIVPIE